MEPKVLVCCVIGPGKEYCRPFLASALTALGAQGTYTVLDGAGWVPENLPGDVEQLPDDVWQSTDPGAFGRQARMRNAGTARMLAGDWTHLYMHDCDTIAPAGAIAALLAHDVPMATGIYNLRTADTLAIPMLPAGTFLHDTPFAADAYGMGCMLLRRDVAEAVSFRADGGDDGEDYCYCLDAIKAGFARLVIDPGVSCWHIRETGTGNRIDVAPPESGVTWMDLPHYITNRYGAWERGVPRHDLTAEQIANLGPGFIHDDYARLTVETLPLATILEDTNGSA